LRRWELLRVESSSPFGILESGSAHPRNHGKRIQETGDRIQELRTSLTDPERILDPSAGFSEQVSHGVLKIITKEETTFAVGCEP
jgi:hypothetical protein